MGKVYEKMQADEHKKTPKQRAMGLLENAVSLLQGGYWSEDHFIMDTLSPKEIEETSEQINKLVDRVYKNELKTLKRV